MHTNDERGPSKSTSQLTKSVHKHVMQTRYDIFIEMSQWYVAYDTYKCEDIRGLQRRSFPTFYPGDMANDYFSQLC